MPAVPCPKPGERHPSGCRCLNNNRHPDGCRSPIPRLSPRHACYFPAARRRRMETPTFPCAGGGCWSPAAPAFWARRSRRELLARRAEVVGLVRDRAAGSVFARHTHPGQFHAVRGRARTPRGSTSRWPFTKSPRSSTSPTRTRPRPTPARRRCSAPPGCTTRGFRSSCAAAVARSLTGRDEPVPVPLGVARFCELFGGGDRQPSRVVPRAVLGLLAGNPVSAAHGPARDFVFVRDAAPPCLAVAEEARRLSTRWTSASAPGG